MIEQGGVRRQLAHLPEVVRRGDDAAAEGVPPETVRDDAGGQRVARVEDAFGQGQPRVDRVGVGLGVDRFEEPLGHGFAELPVVAPLHQRLIETGAGEHRGRAGRRWNPLLEFPDRKGDRTGLRHVVHVVREQAAAHEAGEKAGLGIGHRAVAPRLGRFANRFAVARRELFAVSGRPLDLEQGRRELGGLVPREFAGFVEYDRLGDPEPRAVRPPAGALTRHRVIGGCHQFDVGVVAVPVVEVPVLPAPLAVREGLDRIDLADLRVVLDHVARDRAAAAGDAHRQFLLGPDEEARRREGAVVPVGQHVRVDAGRQDVGDDRVTGPGDFVAPGALRPRFGQAVAVPVPLLDVFGSA